MEIYKILSQIMNDRHLKIADVARMCDLPDSTVRGIEKRKQDTVALEVAFKLSKGLGVSLEYLNGMSENENNINPNPKSNNEYSDIIEKYSSLDECGKKHINYELNREISRMAELQKQSDCINKLKTSNDNDAESATDTRLINYYYRVASAGTGQIIFDMPPTKRIEIPNTPENRKADYAIGVNGSSMEPIYHDGDTLLIEMADEIEVGEIGIFIVDGASYVKKLGDNELISLNPKSENVPLTEDSRCMGRVLGKIES